MVSAKFLLRRAMASATLAKETEDDDCRERCLRLEQLYLRLAKAEGGHDGQNGQGGADQRDTPGH